MYVSNTLAGTSVQTYFKSDETIKTGRIYYKIFKGGSFNYSIMFSNTTDSTFGAHSDCNLKCGEWKIHSLKAGTVSDCSMENATEPQTFTDIYINGKREKTVLPGEVFYTDEFSFIAKKDGYLCLEIEFSGEIMPCHWEIWIPSFIKNGDLWETSFEVPIPSMIGIKRDVKHNIAYLGDSITQGIGADKNSYLNWSARLSELMGEENSYWNIGIGCARANDAATNGVWLKKALMCDTVFICLGVNDILNNMSANEIINNIEKTVRILKGQGKKVIIQSVPPFDYKDEKKEIWLKINSYIKNNISKETDGYFDCAKVLSKSDDEPEKTVYGGHPNNEGGKAWADALYDYVKKIIL